MATNPFGTPQAAPQSGGGNPFGATAPTTNTTTSGGYSNGVVPVEMGNAAAGLEAPATAELPIDPNDPGLTSEMLTVAEGDAFSQPAPPPDGKWRVKLKHEGIKIEGTNQIDPWQGWWQKDKQGNKLGMYARTIASVIIQDPSGKYDGVRLGVPFTYLDTKKQGRNHDGPSKVENILTMLKKPDGTPWLKIGDKANHKQLIELFVKALQTEPEMYVESAWEVTCDVCQAEAKKTGGYAKAVQGMTKFTPSRTIKGQYDPDFFCLVNRGHGTTRARALAIRFFAI